MSEFKETFNNLKLIVAVDKEGGFSKNHKIPWHFKEDLQFFKRTTENSTCIMGRNTYEEILNMKKNKIGDILPNRQSIVISKSLKYLRDEGENDRLVNSFPDAIYKSKNDRIFIIGGEKLYIQTLPFVNEVYMTIINGKYNCDMKFPISYLKNFKVEELGHFDNGIFVKYYR